MGFPAYSGIKESFVFKKGHAKAVRLYTTGEVARLLKLHKMVLLRWIAKGEIHHPVHYCFQGGICLLWDDRDLKAIRSFAKWKKRKRPKPFVAVRRYGSLPSSSGGTYESYSSLRRTH